MTTGAEPQPPVAKYELTLTIHGNSHEEIEGELLGLTRGGYLLDSDYHKRDEFHVTGGRGSEVLLRGHVGVGVPQDAGDLDSWWKARRGSPT